MTLLPSKVQTAACSSSRTRRRKCVPLALRSLSWSVRYDSGLARAVEVAIWCSPCRKPAASLIPDGRWKASLQFRVLGCQLCQSFQIWYFEVRLARCGFGRTRSGTGRWTLYPYRGDPQGLGWNHVVVDALSDVEPLPRGHSEPLLCQLEHF